VHTKDHRNGLIQSVYQNHQEDR